jgi:hypothetical protein
MPGMPGYRYSKTIVRHSNLRHGLLRMNFGFDTPPLDLTNPSPSPESWLASKRQADSQNGASYTPTSSTWRLHDHLYDLTDFIDHHPGGRDWLIMSRGTDITGMRHNISTVTVLLKSHLIITYHDHVQWLLSYTLIIIAVKSPELFETHHPNIKKALSLLKKYHMKTFSPLPPRNSGTFSFHKDGFYATLRDRAWNDVLQHSGTGPTLGMLVLHTSLLVMFLGLLFSAPVLTVTQEYSSESVALEIYSEFGGYFDFLFTNWFGATAMSGVVLALLMMCSHNFFHQQDNWRMFVFDLSPFSSYDWRITHAYSHHVSTQQASLSLCLPTHIQYSTTYQQHIKY